MNKYEDKFSRYKILKCGTVENITTGKTLRSWLCGNGYLNYKMVLDNGKSLNILAHLLIMTKFGPAKPYSGAIVNHKDGNKENCTLSNLEWVDYRENLIHAYCGGLRVSLAPIVALFRDKEFEFLTLSHLERAFKFKTGSLFKKFKKNGVLLGGVCYAKNKDDPTEWADVKLGNRKAYSGRMKRDHGLLQLRNIETGELKEFDTRSKVRRFLNADKHAVDKRLKAGSHWPLNGWSLRDVGLRKPWKTSWTVLEKWTDPLRGASTPILTLDGSEIKIYKTAIDCAVEIFNNPKRVDIVSREAIKQGTHRNIQYFKLETYLKLNEISDINKMSAYVVMRRKQPL